MEERERAAFELVTNEPNQENIQSYLKLAEELQKQVDEARQAADAATYERDKELNEYFKQYGRTYKNDEQHSVVTAHNL
ncbi:hypothetical protein J4727_00080 [Providencia rettgeri]|uniref:Uncharacterized protein n=1 Tax=Providencia rettgeri TaxID=587 RepID=A0A939NJ10_PRORE|nr:hypothetical protein [Providencia rettgeri]